MTNADKYRNKLMSADMIAKQIESGFVISSATALTSAPAISRAIAARAAKGEIRDVVHHTTLELGQAPNYDITIQEGYRGVS